MSRGLSKDVRVHLEKATDSALLAVEVYNKPATKFRSGGFIVLKCISWTSLFHAIFFRDKKQPFYKQANGRYVKIGEDYVFTDQWVKLLITEVKKPGQYDKIKTGKAA